VTSPDANALYGLPREEFTKARNDLARELKQAGDGEAADEVKRLAKPSVSAWAVNQLVRRDPEAASELLDLAARMRRAQAAALDGDASELREVSREEREVVNGLADQAAAEAAGGGAALRDRIASTLRGVVASSDEVQELFRQGHLTEDLEAAGFGTSDPSPVSAPPRRRPRQDGGEVKAAREDARARQRQAKETHTEVRRLAHAVERLQERADTARQEAERAERELEEARSRVAEAEKRLAEDTQEADAAAARVEQLEGGA
jgi:hypothetical protein